MGNRERLLRDINMGGLLIGLGGGWRNGLLVNLNMNDFMCIFCMIWKRW